MSRHVSRSRLIFTILTVLLTIGYGCSDSHSQPVPGSAEQIYLDTLATAKKANKVVQVVFTHPDVVWCERLDEYHAVAEVAEVLQKYLITLHIDVIETPGGFIMF